MKVSHYFFELLSVVGCKEASIPNILDAGLPSRVREKSDASRLNTSSLVVNETSVTREFRGSGEIGVIEAVGGVPSYSQSSMSPSASKLPAVSSIPLPDAVSVNT